MISWWEYYGTACKARNCTDYTRPFTGASCTWAVATGTASAASQTVTCPAGKHPISGGCDPFGTGTAVTSSRPFGPPGNGDAASTVTQWFCEFGASATGHTAYALCCDTI